MILKQLIRICGLVIILLCGLLISCGPSRYIYGDTETVWKPTQIPTKTLAPLPTNFDTYTDENKTFSISYPSDWEVDITILHEKRIPREEWLESINDQLDIGQSVDVFFVGVPCGIDCYHPSCGIVVEPTVDIKSIEEYDAIAMPYLKSVVEEYHDISREITVIDGRESIIREYELTLGGVPIHSLDLWTINGDMVWLVGCAIRPERVDYTEYEDDFHNIVRSLQLH